MEALRFPETLYPVFRRRLPRPGRWKALERQGIDVSDPLEVLRVTGGRLPTDTLEFLEPIEAVPGDSEEYLYTVRFPIAGWRHYSGEAAIAELVPGQRLTLALEPSNPFDPSAIMIHSPSGVMLGYVPAIYSPVLDSAVMRGQYEAWVEEIGPEDDPQRRIVVRFRGAESPLDRVRLVPEDMEKYVAAMR